MNSKFFFKNCLAKKVLSNDVSTIPSFLRNQDKLSFFFIEHVDMEELKSTVLNKSSLDPDYVLRI